MRNANRPEIWFAAGVRTPFAKVDGPLSHLDAIGLSVPVVRHMIGQLGSAAPDFAVWGAVVPNLTWSNIAREVLMDAGVAPTIPAFSTVMACSTSMIGAIEAAGMIDCTQRNLALVGGVESLSRIQLGLGQSLSDWLRKFQQARSLGQKVSQVSELKIGDIKLYIPAVSNRTTGLSMGEHTEITAKEWGLSREDQDRIALESHQRAVAAWDRGFFDGLVIPIGDLSRDTLPRSDTSLEKLAKLPPSFDRTSGRGTLTAGNSSPLTDGAASLWVASTAGLSRLPADVPKARLIDWEIASSVAPEGCCGPASVLAPRAHPSYAASISRDPQTLSARCWLTSKLSKAPISCVTRPASNPGSAHFRAAIITAARYLRSPFGARARDLGRPQASDRSRGADIVAPARYGRALFLTA